MTIFRYPGGKSKKNVCLKILSKAPANFKEYREPFVGGGGVYFHIPPLITRWINDLDQDLMSVYAALKVDPGSFIKNCRAIKSIDTGGTEEELKQKFLEFKASTAESCAEKALKYFFINRTVWNGRVNYDKPSRVYFSNPTGWDIVFTDKLEKAAWLLNNTILTYSDYSRLLEADGDDVWIYCDPPYVKNTNLAPSSQLYKHNFTYEDHELLAEKVKSCKHKVLISYDDDEKGFIRSLYKNFNLYKDEWTYCGSSSAVGQPKTKRKGEELIIMNY